jgi:DNA polymerase alpha subunit A
MLYNQLLYYLSLFDTEKAMSAARGTQRFDEVRALAQANSRGFAEVAGMVEKYLERNGRRYVDMSGLFGFMEKIRI